MGLRVVYLGTPAFAVPTLNALVAAGHEVLEVVTQPDRPKGRHHTLAASPVKLAAQVHGIPVYQPERIRRPESVEHLRGLAPDAMVIVGYGQIIPQSIIDIPPLGIINVHASLLPKLRGAAPIQWAIANGESRTGVTTMRIDAGLDTGDMLLKAETDIHPDETAVELSERLAPMGARLLISTLELNPPGEKQNPEGATLAPILRKQDGWVDWSLPAGEIYNRVRGLQPWPGAFSSFRGARLHIWKSKVSGQISNKAPGALDRDTPLVSCGGGTVLEILELQIEGKKRVPAKAFWNGLRLADNEVLGDMPV